MIQVPPQAPPDQPAQAKSTGRGRRKFWIAVILVFIIALPIVTLWSLKGSLAFGDLNPWAEKLPPSLTVAEKKAMPDDPARIAALIVEGAQAEADKKTPYVMEYREIAYPMGDVPGDTGVCTDLIVRAFRNAGIDLQELIIEDRRANPGAYPKPKYFWQSSEPDGNIDHRRCRNMEVWFRRNTESLSTDSNAEALKNWKAGDVVFYCLGRGKPAAHVAIISDVIHSSGQPYLIDSMPPGASRRSRLNQYAPTYLIHSHYRVSDPSRLRAVKTPDRIKSE